MCKLVSSSNGKDDFSGDFHKSITTREIKLSNIKSTKKNFEARLYLKDVFGFPEHRKVATYGLEYKSTVQQSCHRQVLSHAARIDAHSLVLARRFILIEISREFPNLYLKFISIQSIVGA